MLVAVAAMAFTACQKDNEETSLAPEKKVAVEFNANFLDTRSSFGDKTSQGYPSSWSGNEKVAFSLNEAAFVSTEVTAAGSTANFKIELTDDGTTEGAIYAFSPEGTYVDGVSTAGFTGVSANYDNAYVWIPTEQTPLADSCDESAHLIAATCEYTNGIPASADLQFVPVAGFGKMTISGFTGTIKSVTIAASEAIAGNAYYNYTGEKAGTMVPRTSGTSKSIKLNASNVKNNVFWFGCTPADLSGGSLNVIIEDNSGKTYTKEIDLTDKELAFTEGCVSVFSVDFTGISADSAIKNIADAIAAADSTPIELKGLTVIGVYARGVLVEDTTGKLLVYANSAVDANVGDVVTVEGTMATYGGLRQVASPTVTKTGTTTYNYPTAESFDGAAMDAYLEAPAVKYVKYTGTLAISGNYYNVTVDGAATAIGSISYPLDGSVDASLNGQVITVTGWTIGTSGSKYISTMLVNIESAPYASASDVNVAADATSATIAVKSNTSWTVSCDASWVTSYTKSGSNDGDIAVSFAANTSTEARTATFTITTSAGSKSVALTQKGVSTGGEPTWTLLTTNSLTVGDQIIIAAKDSDYAISTNQKSNNRGAATITKSGETITFGDDTQILTIQNGNTTGTYALYTGEGYLYAASTSKNYLKTESTLSDNGSWNIDIASDGTATIKSAGNSSRGWMRYNPNNGSPLFACYGSGQEDIVIYKLSN